MSATTSRVFTTRSCVHNQPALHLSAGAQCSQASDCPSVPRLTFRKIRQTQPYPCRSPTSIYLYQSSIPSNADMRQAKRGGMRRFPRSEEHTSELQSRQYLVCRLLLEK